ncbi:MAG: glutamate synthase subunit beta [Bilifractor sp.]|jgi:glutamate synthase (NADPH/NADH) small chain
MGKATGFLEYEREENAWLPPEERIENFDEFKIPENEEERRRQAARCMNCGVPLCQSAMKLSGMVTGCPLHNLIPEWNDEVYHGHFRHALSRLLKTSNFPEFTGRVCPALCEKACICGMNDEPVTVHDNELFIIETAFAKGYMKPRIPSIRSGKKVAIVGSGPSGLAVADQLNHRGHSVTVYERDDQIGGLLMYGIPNMKLDKKVVARRRKLMEKEGVTFITGVDVGVDISAEELKDRYDAVVLCCGAKKPRPLAVDGFDTTKGIYFAVDFLKSATKHVVYGETSGFINAEGKRVIIIGGGDTGNDCVGTCIRQGCRSVRQLEMMPEPPKERLASNPWPEWPKVLKTDYGQQEAIALYGSDPRTYETTVKELITTKTGKLSAVTTVKVKFENRKMVEIPGTEETVRCNLLLIAAGFIGCQDYVADAFHVERGPRGTVLTDPDQYRTNQEGVFTAGDMHRGQSLVVWAITEGRACAKQVDEYLMGYSNM